MKKTLDRTTRTALEARVIAVDSSMARFMGYLPNPDEVLRDTGQALSVYREMKTDARTKSLISVAKAAILNYPVRLEKGDARDVVHTFCKDALQVFKSYALVKRLLAAFEYGFAAVEIVWENTEGWWRPVDAVARKPERFGFDAEGRLLYRPRGGTPVDLFSTPYKWIVYRHDKDAENPYGTSALKSCYWPWKFKKAGLEFWLMATEKFAVPSILALFDASGDEAIVQKRASDLSVMLSRVGSGSGAALANIKQAQVLKADGALSEFRTLMDWCDTQIAYGIVYQSLAVQEVQNGTRAQAEVHADLFRASSKLVCRDLEPEIQRLIAWMVELNFGPDELAPMFQFDLADYASWAEVCDAIDRGVPVSVSALYDRYGVPPPNDEDDTFIASERPAVQLADTGKKKAPGLKLLRR